MTFFLHRATQPGEFCVFLPHRATPLGEVHAFLLSGLHVKGLPPFSPKRGDSMPFLFLHRATQLGEVSIEFFLPVTIVIIPDVLVANLITKLY